MTGHRQADAGSEIILSAADPRMPAHLARDWDTQAMTPGDTAPTEVPDHEAVARRQGPLALLRMPERWLWRHYSRSRLHQYLHHTCAWYQELEDEWRLGGRLERLYGAGSRPRYRLQRFVTGNLAAAVLIGLFAVQAGRAGVDALVQGPAPARTEPMVTATAAVPDGPATPVAAAATARPPDVDLEHCSLSPLLRSSLASADGAARHAAMTEIERFQSRYATSGVETRWRRHLQRLQLTTAAAQRLLPVVTRYHARLHTARSRLQARHAELAETVAAGNSSATHDVARINQHIKQRDALDRLEREMAAGPTAAQIAALGKAVDTLEGYAKADGSLPGPAPRRTAAQAWAVKAQGLGAEQLGLELESLFRRDIRAPIAAGASAASTLDRYRVDTVTGALVAFNQLLSLQHATPLNLPGLDQEQAGTNHRLAGLLALQPAARLLDYRGCRDRLPALTQLSASR